MDEIKYFRLEEKDGQLAVYPTEELLSPHGDTLVSLELDFTGNEVTAFWETGKTCGETSVGVMVYDYQSDVVSVDLTTLTVDTPLFTSKEYKFVEN